MKLAPTVKANMAPNSIGVRNFARSSDTRYPAEAGIALLTFSQDFMKM